jgi:hypothetical protein
MSMEHHFHHINPNPLAAEIPADERRHKLQPGEKESVPSHSKRYTSMNSSLLSLCLYRSDPIDDTIAVVSWVVDGTVGAARRVKLAVQYSSR